MYLVRLVGVADVEVADIERAAERFVAVIDDPTSRRHEHFASDLAGSYHGLLASVETVSKQLLDEAKTAPVAAPKRRTFTRRD